MITYPVLPFLCPGAILGKLYKIPGMCSDPPYFVWNTVRKQCQQLMQSVFLQSWEGRMLKICSQLCWVQQPHSQLLCHSLLPHHSSCLCTAKVCSLWCFVSSSLARRVVHLLNADMEVVHTLSCAQVWNLPLLICEMLFWACSEGSMWLTSMQMLVIEKDSYLRFFWHTGAFILADT